MIWLAKPATIHIWLKYTIVSAALMDNMDLQKRCPAYTEHPCDLVVQVLFRSLIPLRTYKMFQLLQQA